MQAFLPTPPAMSASPVPRGTTPLTRKYGEWAVVTGASSGIGAEFARQLAVSGFSLVLVARRAERLEQLAALLRSTCGVSVAPVAVDLTARDAVPAVLAACAGRDVGLLVNNAGVELHGSFFRQPADAHRDMLLLNVVAVTALAHAFGRRFCEQRRGGMVFVSSISAGGMPWFATYSASKAFVSTLALVMRDEVARCGVDVLALEPGLVVSEMTLDGGQGGEVPRYIMPVEVCVEDGLRMLGKKAVWTPGWKNRVIKTVLYALPRTLALWLVAEWYKTLMEDEVFEYCRETEEGEARE